jgi:hypothetical protein
MAQQTINVGAAPNDGTGTPLRTAFQYTNSNFTELYTAVGPSGNNIVVPGTATITGDLTVDTNVLKVDTTNNNVGIGTTTPASYAFNDPVKLAIANDGTAGAGNTFTIVSGSTGFGQIAFANGTSGTSRYNGYIKYSHSTNAMEFYTTAGALQATLNSNGLGVGAASPVTRLQANKAGQTPGGASAPNGALVISDTSTTSICLELGSNSAGIPYIQSRHISSFGFYDLVLQPTSGNVGIGVTPSAWNATYNVLDIGQNGSISGRTSTNNTVDIVSNGFRDSGGTWVYKLAASSAASRYQIDGGSGSHLWYNGVAGTAGNTIAGFSTPIMTLDSNGNLILLSSNTPATLSTNGQLTVNATSNTNLRFSYRGSDGTTRVANITLA